MTYCAAWKHDGKVFLIGDSITSSESNEDLLYGKSSFGEMEGLYSRYSTRETSQKIIKINDTTAVAYSCDDQKVVLEAISFFDYLDSLSLEDVLKTICGSFGTTFELIVISKVKGQNRIYHVKEGRYYSVEDFVDIGSGKDIQDFSFNVKKIIDDSNNKNTNDVEASLASIVSLIQCMSMKHKFIKYGVGGAFFGIYLERKIFWCKDIMYHFSNESDDKNIVSIISRMDTVFYASSFNEKMRYFFDESVQKQLEKNKYLLESIVKTLNTAIPQYFVFYDFHTNAYVFIITKGYSSTENVKFWIKRQAGEVKYAILSDPLVVDSLRNNSAVGQAIPSVRFIRSHPTPFENRESFIKKNKLEMLVQDLNLSYDLDFNYYKPTRKSSHKSPFDKFVSKYRNIIVIDSHYLDQLVEEKLKYYKLAAEQLGLDLDFKLKLEAIVTKFSRQIASDNFNEYLINILIKSSLSSYLQNVLRQWKNEHSNLVVTVDHTDNYLVSNIESLVKNYYTNESYFHLDKIILFCDDLKVNEFLQYVPTINFEKENVDIILIREINGLTKMDGKFIYIVSDTLISEMYELPLECQGYAEHLIYIDLMGK